MRQILLLFTLLLLFSCISPGVSGDTIVPSTTSTSTHTATPSPTITLTRIPTTTATPRPKPTNTNTPIPTVVTYTVQVGDILSQIATVYGKDVYDLARANQIDNPDLIQVGQVIQIIDPPPITPPSPTLLLGKQIIVVLSTQRTYAFEDGLLLKTFIVSTGLPNTPTLTTDKEDFHVYVKYEATLMQGPDYYLPNVPWTMYFYQGYGFHGTYWHNNFGRPMSHGCVNLATPDADWLYHWAEVGTAVHIIY